MVAYGVWCGAMDKVCWHMVARFWCPSSAVNGKEWWRMEACGGCCCSVSGIVILTRFHGPSHRVSGCKGQGVLAHGGGVGCPSSAVPYKNKVCMVGVSPQASLWHGIVAYVDGTLWCPRSTARSGARNGGMQGKRAGG
eukprot:1161627-Pelagomonas_calceolata.AAC.2